MPDAATRPREQRKPAPSAGRALFRTLYCTRQGANLRLDNDNILIAHQEETTRIRLRDVRQIAILGRVNLTTPLLTHCLEQGLPIIFLGLNGAFLGRLDQGQGRDLDLLRSQLALVDASERRLDLARRIVRAKISSQARFLETRRGRAEIFQKSVSRLRGLANSALRCRDLNALMGLEGVASREHFACYAQALTPSHGFSGRQRRPAKDPVNSLLNLGYALLLNDVLAHIVMSGLDARPGLLHQERRGRPALAFDMMEELRAPVVERLALRCLNTKRFSAKDFQEHESGGLRLKPDSLRRFIMDYEDAAAALYHHEPSVKKADLRRIMALQCQDLKAELTGRGAYRPANLGYT